jgi:peptidoglycan/xylan/chitin deacetylase (PgdA/CDA1 family)
MYHAVDASDAADRMSLRVAQPAFRAQMALLREERYSVVPLARVCDGLPDNGRVHVAITFDDGYRSQMWAAEILAEFGFAATFFVVPRFLDGGIVPAAYWERWEYMGWDEAAALRDRGFEIGAHSSTHPDLRRCSDERLEDETAGAKRVLEERLGTEIVSFSYPHGRHDGRVRREVARAGYRIGCTSRYGVNRVPATAFSIRRTEVAGTDTLDDFRAKLDGQYDWLAYWQALALAR